MFQSRKTPCHLFTWHNDEMHKALSQTKATNKNMTNATQTKSHTDNKTQRMPAED